MKGFFNMTSGGIGFFGLLTIAFIILKLTHIIDWPWWLVIAPLWAPTVALFGIGIIVLIIAFFATLKK